MRASSVRHIARGCVLAVSTMLGQGAASAQTCGSEYTVRDGDTLSSVAARAYGNPAQWTLIFYANQDRLGANVSLLVPGLAIRIPCPGGTSGAAAPATTPPATASQSLSGPAPDSQILISSVVRHMETLTADGYPPYTGRALEGGGMLTEVVTTALNIVKVESKGKFDFGISWVNDWSAHLNPLLLTRAFDVGFPWARPNCDDPQSLSADGQLRCQRFYFSEPLYEVVTTIFVRNDSKITALRGDLISGTTICRPTGYPTSDFDQNGRQWLREGKIKLMRPATVSECFKLLAAGNVDAVAVAELVGRSAAAVEGMGDTVRELDPPLSLTSLHVIVSKAHPYARTMLYYVNSGLAKLRSSGEYDQIVERHIARFWDSQVRPPSAAMAVTPAAAARPTEPPKAADPPKLGETPKQRDPAKPAESAKP
jgi:polar amino acid transport system substrate-binding protein